MNIISINPSNESTGAILGAPIVVVFSGEMDHLSIENGGFVLSGVDTSTILIQSREATIFSGDELNNLESPEVTGIVQGTYTVVFVDKDTGEEIDEDEDTAGAGNLYNTKLTFLPTNKLKPSTKYTVLLQSPETDTSIGVKNRSVFATQEETVTTSTGKPFFYGTYKNTGTTNINIRIVESGAVGVFTYEYWFDDNPVDLKGPILSKQNQYLDRGVLVSFALGNYTADDEWSALVKHVTSEGDTLISTFTTGSGSIRAVPSEASTLITGAIANIVPNEFVLLESSVADNSANLASKDIKTITLTFSKDLDESTIDFDSLIVRVEPAIDHPSLDTQTKPGNVNYSFTVEDNKLIITF